MFHYYWSIICKTPECAKHHLIYYLGKNALLTQYSIYFEYECDQCCQLHEYVGEDLNLFSARTAPSGEFKDAF